MLLPSYLAQHQFSIFWQLVLEDMLEDVLEIFFIIVIFFSYPY